MASAKKGRHRSAIPSLPDVQHPHDALMTELTQPIVEPDSPTTERRADERGQGVIEYAFILILIAITLIIALQTLGHQTTNLFSNIQNGISTASGH
jgi:Flp pilus assembly pilin Flp